MSTNTAHIVDLFDKKESQQEEHSTVLLEHLSAEQRQGIIESFSSKELDVDVIEKLGKLHQVFSLDDAVQFFNGFPEGNSLASDVRELNSFILLLREAGVEIADRSARKLIRDKVMSLMERKDLMEMVRNRDTLRLGDQEELQLPDKAPELFINRQGQGQSREGAIDFLDRIWGRYLDAGLLYQFNLRSKKQGQGLNMDSQLMQAIVNHCRKTGEKTDSYIPRMQEKNTHQINLLGLEDPVILRLTRTAYRRKTL
jgi:hypothetical protein